MEEEKEGRKLSEKTIKIAIISIVIIIVMVIALWGMAPEKIYEVSKALEDPSTHEAQVISVKGVVTGWNTSSGFNLVDSTDYSLSINITHTSVFPDGFGNGETVVVKGVFNIQNGAPMIESSSIQIGCPSKY